MRPKFSCFFAFLTLLLFAGCETVKFSSSQVTQLSIQEGPTSLSKRTFSSPSEVSEIMACLDRAVLMESDSEQVSQQLLHGYILEIVGAKPVSGTWLYDKTEGRFSRNQSYKKSYYVLRPFDRDRVNAIVFKELNTKMTDR